MATVREKRIYLASPYSSQDSAVRQDRYEEACKKAAELMSQGYNVFSPIAHSHPISQHIGNGLDHDFWLSQDLSFLESWADEMWVLMLPGWEESIGIWKEVNFATEKGIKIKRCAV